MGTVSKSLKTSLLCVTLLSAISLAPQAHAQNANSILADAPPIRSMDESNQATNNTVEQAASKIASETMTPMPIQALHTPEPAYTSTSSTDLVYGSMANELQAAVAQGIKNHPQYRGIQAGLRATDEELRQGKALYYPSIDLNADAGYEDTNDLTSRSRPGKDDDIDLFRSQAGITLTQMLFDGFEAKYEIERQKARVNSSVHRVTDTQETVGLSITEAYLDVLRQRYLVSISAENIQDHKDILAQIKSGVQAGRSTYADMDQAKARLAAAEATMASTIESLEAAESQYYRQVGAEAGDLIMPSIPYAALRPTLAEEIRYDLNASPALKTYASDIEVAYAEAMGTQASYYPNVDLELSANYADDLSGIETYEKNARALMVMNWNLYRGGADTARERELHYRHEQAKAQYSDAARALEDEIRQTWNAMIAAGKRAEKYDNQVKANIEVAKAYKDQFTLSRRTLLDVLDAQNELFVSKVDKINAEFVQIFSVYRLLSLRGELLASLGVHNPDFRSAQNYTVEWDHAEKMKAR